MPAGPSVMSLTTVYSTCNNSKMPIFSVLGACNASCQSQECATYTEVLSAQTILLAGASYSFRNQELAVVGGGDTAVEEAIYLTKYGTMVSLQSGPARLCSIPEASCSSLMWLCIRAGWIRSDTSGTRAKLIMKFVLNQRCLFKHFVYCFSSACRQAT